MSDSNSNAPNRNQPQLTEATSVNHLCGLVRNVDSLLVVGNRTKPPLSAVDSNTLLVSTRQLVGISEYEPSEFTFTAQAGTTLGEINAALHEKQQYLPFDPMLVDQGATIAGTLAAGLSGPGRHRYGGTRDFVLGVQFVAGDGELIRAGGKVVKNAAGFDIPKLLVGSCGRLGAITELTFKVFPKPVRWQSYCIECTDHTQACKWIADIARGRWELDAIDYQSDVRRIWIRIGGEKTVCDAIVNDIARTIEVQQIVPQTDDEASLFWTRLAGLEFGGDQRDLIVKVPMNLDTLASLATWCDQHSDSICLHNSVAGSIGWLAIKASFIDQAESFLQQLGLAGLLVRGLLARDPANPGGRCLVGHRTTAPIETAIKAAMDPPGHFPGFAE